MPESMFGPYRIEGVLGTGGMGEVYRARNTRTDRAVALKLLLAHLAEDEGYRARFLRECRAAGGLSEPHVVPIHDFGDIDGRLYLEMRLVEGTNLGTWLGANGPAAPEVALAVVTHVAQALDAAHAKGLVHRDVKPSNILLAGVSGGPVDAAEVFAYLCDFGVARARGEPGLTSVGAVPGSARYVAPERFEGVEGDPRADVYSLACVLHETLTGRPPFAGDFPALMRAHVQDPPPVPSGLRPGLTRGLDEVVARGMAKDPDERYPSAGRLAAAARAALAGAPVAPTTPAVPTTPIPAQGTAPGGAPGTPRTGDEQRPAGPTAPRGRRAGAGGPERIRGRAAPGAAGPGRAARPTGGAPTSPAPGGSGRAPAGHGARDSAGPAGIGTDAYPVRNREATSLPPQVPPGRGGLRSTLVWIAAVVAVVTVAVTGFVLASDTTAGGTPAAPPAAPPAGPLTDQDKLLRDLPSGFTAAGCTPDDGLRTQTRALAVVRCNGGSPPGAVSAVFARFDSSAHLDTAFSDTATGLGIVVGPDDQIEQCRTGGSTRQPWGDAKSTLGEVGCVVDPNGVARLLWSRTETLTLCSARRSDGNAAALYDWWAGSAVVPA